MTFVKSLSFLITIYLFILLFLHTYAQPKRKFFRKDYTFLPETQSFYKIHTLHKTWQDAKRTCEMEGASLFYPRDSVEANAVIKFWQQTQGFAWIFIGVSDLLSKGVYETIDGISILDVYNNWARGEPNDMNGEEDCTVLSTDGTINDDSCAKKWPYLCKKSLLQLDWNDLCDIPDLGYMYSADLGKCYKFHLTPMNWTSAYAVCSAEQSYLAIINSKEEAEYLVKMTEDAPKSKVKGDFLSGAVYLGYHNRFGEGWKTIKGIPLEENGYDKWGNQQPDGGNKETCGSMFYNGHLNDLNCERRCFFVCEHDIPLLSGSIIERFGNSNSTN